MTNIICGVLLALLFGALLTLIIIYAFYTDKERKEYLLSLNEHDLAVIQRYLSCGLFPFKKGVKK